MSLTVAVIPEDASQNGYILKPIVEGILDACGKPRAKVKVPSSPRLHGYEDAKKMLEVELIDRYRHFDLLLFMPDSDGKDRSAEFNRLEGIAKEKGANLLCCAAVPEVEIWLLAGHKEKLPNSWSQLRTAAHIKESVFRPFLNEFGNPDAAGQGRETLARETARNMLALFSACPELKELHDKIQVTLRRVEP